MTDTHAAYQDRVPSAEAMPFLSWPAREIELPGRTMVVREAAGTGAEAEPAVFIHGLGGSADNWIDLMGLLRDRVDGIAPDLSGFGDSPPPHDGDYSMDGHARGVAALLEERFAGQRVHVFGNSMGGAVAVHLAARRPDLVRSLTLISPALPARRPRPTNVHLPAISMPVFGEWSYDRYQKVSADRRAQASIDLCFAEPSAVPPFRKQITSDLLARRDGYPYAREAFLGSLRALMGSYLTAGANRPWALARTVGAPTLIIFGRDDKLVDPAMAFRVTKDFPQAEVQVLNNCGHVAQMEKPEHVAAAWREHDARWADLAAR